MGGGDAIVAMGALLEGLRCQNEDCQVTRFVLERR